MRPFTHLGVLLLSLAACSSKPAESQGPSKAPSASSAAAPVAAKIDCARLVPPEMQTKYGLGEGKTESHPNPAMPQCLFKAGKSPIPVTFNYQCMAGSDDHFRQMMEGAKTVAKDAKDLPGVGRAAYVMSQMGIRMVQLWDDDTSCLVTFTVPESASAEEMGRDVVKYLTPAAIK